MQRRAETDTSFPPGSGAAGLAFTLNNEKTPQREATTTGENQKYCFTMGGKMQKKESFHSENMVYRFLECF